MGVAVVDRRGEMRMAQLTFGVWDAFGAYEVGRFPTHADIYEQHIREVQLAEELGYRYYFIIEHQNSPVGQITSPSVKIFEMLFDRAFPASNEQIEMALDDKETEEIWQALEEPGE
jgi:hypothetical protein